MPSSISILPSGVHRRDLGIAQHGPAWWPRSKRRAAQGAFLTAIGRLAGLRIAGMMAPMVLDGPIKRLAFQAYVEQVLCPNSAPPTSW